MNAKHTARPGVEVSISLTTILLGAGAVGVGWALVSIADVLLVIPVSVFNIVRALAGGERH